MLIKSRFLIFFCFFYGMLSATAQNHLIHKLQKKLAHTKDSIAYVNTLNRIGMLMHLKDPDSCFIYSTKARHISQRLKYTKGVADASNNIAISLYTRGMHNDAIKLFSKVLASYTQQKDTANMAQVYLNMASVYSSIRDTVNALKYSRKSMQLGANIPHDSIMSLVYANYCNVNARIPEDSAQYYLDKAYTIAMRYHDEHVIIALQQLRAGRFLSSGNKEKALPYIQSSLDAARAAGLEYNEITSLSLMANYYADDPQKALSYYQQIIEIAEENGYRYLKGNVLQGMLHAAEQLGDKDQQLAISKLLITAVTEREKHMKQFVGDYMAYNNLQNDYKLLEITQKSTRKRLFLMISLCAVSLLLLIIVFRLYTLSKNQSRKRGKISRMIQQKNEALEEADVFKNKLVSILAHDFRAPLISTLSIAEILKENISLSEAEMEIFYRKIKEDASDMLEQFDTILQWIRQQLTGYHLVKEQLQLYELFGDSITINHPLIAQKAITVLNKIPEDLKVLSDREMLQFINRNLLSNAIRFSDEKGTIQLSAFRKNREVIVSVADDGNGLSPEVLQKLFRITEIAGGTTHNGAGIALFMCRDFIEKLGGRIWAENHTTKGAIFYYALPYESPA